MTDDQRAVAEYVANRIANEEQDPDIRSQARLWAKIFQQHGFSIEDARLFDELDTDAIILEFRPRVPCAQS